MRTRVYRKTLIYQVKSHIFTTGTPNRRVDNSTTTLYDKRMLKVLLAGMLLVISNFFMTYAWYGFLRKPGEGVSDAWWKLVLLSWGVAFFEYCFMVPANHIGRAAGLSLAQLKIMQEAITLCIFVPFMVFIVGDQWKWDYLWAFLCVMGAVFFVNREALMG